MIKEGDLVPEQLDEFLATEYLAAVEMYKSSNPLVRVTKNNFWACIKVMQEGGLALENCRRLAYLSALAQLAAAGTLDRERTAEENAERERHINAERERRDRHDGNIGTPRGHLDEHETERLELQGRKNLLNNLRALQQKVASETSSPEAQRELTATDALYALTGGDASKPLSREHVTNWLVVWKPDLCRTALRRQEKIRERVDAVLAGHPDPMTGVENV